MHFYSTNKKSRKHTFAEAVLAGLAPDGGLFMPDSWPRFSKQFLKKLGMLSYNEVAYEAAKHFVAGIRGSTLKKIVRDAFNFPVPLVHLEGNLYLLELFHGPTMAFKDFGARFLSRIAGRFLETAKKEMTIIVATSGDTGSAVASGFFNVPNVRVFILFPKGKVSPLQEKQLTTYGRNITAIEVKGTFDDCQRLAKIALSDSALVAALNLSSANSINFGRLLPQSFYYIWAASELKRKGVSKKPVFVVPSGNFGNGFAGLMAKKRGLPVSKFLFATNANAIVPAYLRTGKFSPKRSKKTISNAMDVGNPSNFARILDLYGGSRSRIKKDIESTSVTDAETRSTIRDVFKKTGMVIDPHTAVGVSAARRYQKEHNSSEPLVVLSTAHPAKFREVVEPVVKKKVMLPRQLQKAMKKKKQSVVLSAQYAVLKKFLLSHS